jgi:hypothetical protein
MNRQQRRLAVVAARVPAGLRPVVDLSNEAHRIITDRMTRDFNNGLSEEHREALMRVVGRLSLMAYGCDPGRWAMDLPCGAGKTQGVVAWLTAVHRLSLDKSAVTRGIFVDRGTNRVYVQVPGLGPVLWSVAVRSHAVAKGVCFPVAVLNHRTAFFVPILFSSCSA